MMIEKLAVYGANIEEGMERCLNNESFYIRLVKMIPGDANFQKLYDAIDSGDLDAAFEAAHALKGSAANLALDPITVPVSEITELLRAHTDTDYSPYIDSIKKAQTALVEICEE